MRGKEIYYRALIIRTRITPAYAGKRDLNGSQIHLLLDHPRVCGEKTKKIP